MCTQLNEGTHRTEHHEQFTVPQNTASAMYFTELWGCIAVWSCRMGGAPNNCAHHMYRAACATFPVLREVPERLLVVIIPPERAAARHGRSRVVEP